MDIDRPNPLSERVLGKQPERPTLPWSEVSDLVTARTPCLLDLGRNI
jgi:hypothetical protein